jgi:tetratricopeptide (TPR) repeat protein
VVALEPGNVDARANLGSIAFLRGDCVAAEAAFKPLVVEQPELVKAQALLGLAQACLGHSREASGPLAKAYPKLPGGKLRRQVGMALFEIHYRGGSPDEAIDTLRQLQREDGSSPEVLYAAARLYTDLANNARDALAASAPDSARLRQLMAQHLVNAGDLDGAIAQYRRALALDPQGHGIHYELGEALLQQSTTPEALAAAEKEFRKALAEDPGNGVAEYRLGRIQALRGDYQGALEHYGRALALRPDYANAHVRAAEALRTLGDMKGAEDHLLQAIRLEPGNLNAHFRLAGIYRDTGRASEGEAELKVFRTLEQARARVEQTYAEMHQTMRDRDGKE